MHRRLYQGLGGRHARLAMYSMRQWLRGSTVVNGAGIALHFDPRDIRGRQLWANGGVLDHDAVVVWRRLCKQFSPDVVLDVGANYGEVALATGYPSHVEVHLVEPSPHVLRRLRKTVSALPSRIVLHEYAASNMQGTAILYVKRNRSGVPSSGLSSLVRDASSGGCTVRTHRLDQTIVIAANARLLFKIDVEGHEVPVLDGMVGLLEGRKWLGLVEFGHLSKQDLDLLHRRFAVALVRKDTLALVLVDSLHELVSGQAARGTTFTKDVVISSQQDELSQVMAAYPGSPK